MACFIDGTDYYEYLSRQIDHLHIGEQMNRLSHSTSDIYMSMRSQAQEKFENFKKQLKDKFSKSESYTFQKRDLFSHMYHGKFTPDLEIFVQEQFQTSLNNTKINNTFSIYSRICVKKQMSHIEITSTILKNGITVQPKSKPFKLLLSRYFNKLNATFRDGSFRLNPFTGCIFFQMGSILSSRKFEELIFDVRACIEYIQSELQSTIQYARYNFYKILYLIQELPDDYLKYLEHNRQRFRKITRQQKTLELIQKIIQCSSYDYDFMFNNQVRKNITESEVNILLEKSKNRFDLIANNTFSINTKTDFNKVSKIFNYYNNSTKCVDPGKYSYKSTYNFFKDYDKNFIRYLNYPTAKIMNTNEKTNIFSQIVVCNPEKVRWQIIGEGGFSKIQRGQINYTYFVRNQQMKKQSSKNSMGQSEKNNQGILKKFLVKKTDKTNNAKIPHEKNILNHIRDMYCINITKFYESSQPELKSSLLMDFYTSKSLEFYKRTNQEILSLLSRFYILIQAIQGIRFLRDNKVVHLDLKPQNLLIGKGLLLRITDFGESYHPEVCVPEYRPGYTIPYAAPQIFESLIPFGDKLDVFSLGMIMHQILFQCFPLEVRRMSNDKIMNLYKTNNYVQMSLTTPQRPDAYGPKDLTSLICGLCLKCMSRNLIDRPSLDWIQVVLKQCINYLDSLY